MPQLREYQEEDVAKLITQDSMGVFNEQRTGKTPTSLTAMKRKGVYRLLIVCPASLCYAWKEEVGTWFDADALVLTSASKFNKQMSAKYPPFLPPVIIVNYENLRDTKVSKGAWEKLLKKFKPDGLIVDEVHRCKNRDTANFKAVDKFRHIDYRLYLSATPAPNKPWDIWAIIHLIRPNTYTSYWDFIHMFFIEEVSYVANQPLTNPIAFKPGMEAFLQRSLDAISVMRKRKDVMPWLPEQDRPTVIKLPCTATQKKYITELETMFETEHVNTQGVLDQLIRIRQVCAYPAILGLKGGSPKMEWLQQYLEDYPEKSVVVFSNSKKFLNFVHASVKCSCLITGDTPALVRQQHIVSFQNKTTRVIFLQTQAGKEGLTLDSADVTIFLDTYPPAADYLQAKDRMIPTSPEKVKPQEIIHVMMKGTYDERLYDIVAQNVADTDIINDYKKYLEERRKHNG